MLYELVEGRFVAFQRFATMAAKQWTHFAIDGRHFLGLAQGVTAHAGHDGPNAQSCLFEWNGERFEPFQQIESAWGYNWCSMTVGGRQLLAYADHAVPSRLLVWNGANFEPFQTLEGIPQPRQFFAVVTCASVGIGGDLPGSRDTRDQAAAAAGVAFEDHRVDVRLQSSTAQGQRVERYRPGFTLGDLANQIGDGIAVTRLDHFSKVAAHDVARLGRAEQVQGGGVHRQDPAVCGNYHDPGRHVLDDLAQPLLARPCFGLLGVELDALVDAAQRRDQPAAEDAGLEHRVIGAQFQGGRGDIRRAGRRQHDDGQI